MLIFTHKNGNLLKANHIKILSLYITYVQNIFEYLLLKL